MMDATEVEVVRTGIVLPLARIEGGTAIVVLAEKEVPLYAGEWRYRMPDCPDDSLVPDLGQGYSKDR